MTEKVISTLYEIDGTVNRGRGWGGAPNKWADRAYWVGRDGRTVPMIFTNRMFDEAEAIAARNKEDCGEHAPIRHRAIEIVEGSGVLFAAAVSIAVLAGVAIGLMF